MAFLRRPYPIRFEGMRLAHRSQPLQRLRADFFDLVDAQRGAKQSGRRRRRRRQTGHVKYTLLVSILAEFTESGQLGLNGVPCAGAGGLDEHGVTCAVNVDVAALALNHVISANITAESAAHNICKSFNLCVFYVFFLVHTFFISCNARLRLLESFNRP